MNVAKIRRIEQHGKNLLKLFPKATERDPLALAVKVRRIDADAAKIGLRLCNGPDIDEDALESWKDRIHKRLAKLLGESKVPVFINQDPRGHALKINDRWMTEHKAVLYKDWGGYGVLAPDFD